MKKDIIIPVVKDVHIAIKHEWNDDFTSRDWMCYLINNGTLALESVMVMTRGKDDTGRKTSTLRHAFPVVPAKKEEKIEPIMEDVFGFTNEFVLTYFIGDTLYDKVFTALPNTISEDAFVELPVSHDDGVLVG